MADAAWLKRQMFHFFMGVAQRVGARKLAAQSVGRRDTLLYALGHGLVYGPLKDNLGLGRIRLAYTAGEAIGLEIFTFLSLAGDQCEATVRHDRGERVCLRAARRRGTA